MDEHLVLRDDVRLIDCSVSHTRANHQKKVRLVHGPVRIGLPVISHHTVVHRMFRGHYADPHHGRDYRYTVFFREETQFFFRIA